MKNQKTLTEAGKRQLITKTEKILCELEHLNQMAKDKGGPVATAAETALKKYLEKLGAHSC